MRPSELSGSNLAFLGDAVLSLQVRTWLLEQGYTRSGELNRLAIQFVNAHAQARFMQALLDQGDLTEEELEAYKRGRNHRGGSRAKNADIVTYRVATGFEALLGYWHLTRNQERLGQVWRRMREMVDLSEAGGPRTHGES